MRDAELEFGLLTVEVIPASCSNVAADVPPPAVEDAEDGEVAVCRFRVIGTRVSLSMDSEKDSGRLANDVGVGRCEGEVVI